MIFQMIPMFVGDISFDIPIYFREYSTDNPFGGFHKWGYPQIIPLNGIFHDINHPFWGTPIDGNLHLLMNIPVLFTILGRAKSHSLIALNQRLDQSGGLHDHRRTTCLPPRLQCLQNPQVGRFSKIIMAKLSFNILWLVV